LAKLADRKSLVAKSTIHYGLGTLVFRDASSLSGTLKMENGTSVTVGNWIKTLHLGDLPECFAIIAWLWQM